MTKFYVVYSREFRDGGPEEGVVVEVVQRTDKKTAEQDADLLTSVCRRAAWIEEQGRP